MSLFEKNRAPGYASYGWIEQDWRSVFLKGRGIVYDKKCGEEGSRLPSGSQVVFTQSRY